MLEILLVSLIAFSLLALPFAALGFLFASFALLVSAVDRIRGWWLGL